MRPDNERDFDQNMNQLVQLLKKILKNLPANGQSKSTWPNSEKETGINVNLCFFTFLPVTPEELDELEELYDQYLSQEDRKTADWSTELSASDVEFLRRHGIRF